MPITLEINGNPFTNFEQVSLQRSMETLASTFNILASIDNFDNFNIKLGDECRVLIDDIPAITGFVDLVRPSYDGNSHNIQLAGADKTIDVVDSSALSNVNYQPNITLASIVRRLLRGNNIQGIDVIDEANPKIFKQGDIIGGEVGQNLFEIIDKYCKKRQILATTDGNGNIVLTRASEVVINTKLTQRKGSRENNILSASAEYSIGERFHSYVVFTQGNPTSLNLRGGRAPAETIVNQKGGAIDSEIRRSRDLVISADTSNTSQSAKDRGIWEANIRRARSFNYNCQVQGFSFDNGQIWRPNLLVRVEDEKCDIFGELLIKSVSYSYDSNSGSITNLTMGFRDSFTLQAEQDALLARSNKAGEKVKR